jgi:hypothetical protein
VTGEDSPARGTGTPRVLPTPTSSLHASMAFKPPPLTLPLVRPAMDAADGRTLDELASPIDADGDVWSDTGDFSEEVYGLIDPTVERGGKLTHEEPGPRALSQLVS